MKAPSPLCLLALRRIALHTSQSSTRCYSSARQQQATPPTPPTPRTPPSPPTPPPAAHLTRPPTQPGFRTRQKSDDDDSHTPVPLSRPIGMPTPPRPGENTGLDARTLRKRRDDFVDYNKHLARRDTMTKQIAKPYFRDWSNLRFHKGKVFVAPARMFRADGALYMPNFFGRRLRKGEVRSKWRGDGYGGLGRDTCEVMKGRVSVVSLFSSAWAVNQVKTFVGRTENPSLEEVIRESGGVAQRVEVNYEDNVLKYWVLRLFGLGNLRKERSVEEQGRYFVVRRGFGEAMKEGLGVLNEKAGYVYLVDAELRIRWAGSAIAEEHERESLVRAAKKLIQEARGERGSREKRLESAVQEVTEVEEERKSAAAAG